MNNYRGCNSDRLFDPGSPGLGECVERFVRGRERRFVEIYSAEGLYLVG